MHVRLADESVCIGRAARDRPGRRAGERRVRVRRPARGGVRHRIGRRLDEDRAPQAGARRRSGACADPRIVGRLRQGVGGAQRRDVRRRPQRPRRGATRPDAVQPRRPGRLELRGRQVAGRGAQPVGRGGRRRGRGGRCRDGRDARQRLRHPGHDGQRPRAGDGDPQGGRLVDARRGGGEPRLVAAEGRHVQREHAFHGDPAGRGGRLRQLPRRPGGPLLLRARRELGRRRSETGRDRHPQQHRQAVGDRPPQGRDPPEAGPQPPRGGVRPNDQAPMTNGSLSASFGHWGLLIGHPWPLAPPRRRTAVASSRPTRRRAPGTGP